jgi:2'-5' RNA ligase
MIHEAEQDIPSSNLRLFTGIATPRAVEARIDELVRQLKPLAAIRWSPTSNFHITTKFIGAWPEDRLQEIKDALAGVPRTGAFKIAIRGLGFFPDAQRPRSFWIGVDGGAELKSLASRIDQTCSQLGVVAEKKPYTPHLTLARTEPKAKLEALHMALEKMGSPLLGEFDATVFHLYLSQPGRSGAIYTSLEEFPL